MQPRLKLALLALTTLVLLGLIVALVAQKTHDDASRAAADVQEVGIGGGASKFKGAARPITAPSDFALHDQDGRLVRTEDLRGKVLIVTPMYTTCHDACPLIAGQIRDALKDIGPEQAAQVRALAISVDPRGDNAESAKRFLGERDVNGYLDFLLGERSELQPVWKKYGFSEQLASQEHVAYVVLLDRQGRQRVGYPVQYLTPEDLEHDLKVLIAERNA